MQASHQAAGQPEEEGVSDWPSGGRCRLPVLPGDDGCTACVAACQTGCPRRWWQPAACPSLRCSHLVCSCACDPRHVPHTRSPCWAHPCASPAADDEDNGEEATVPPDGDGDHPPGLLSDAQSSDDEDTQLCPAAQRHAAPRHSAAPRPQASPSMTGLGALQPRLLAVLGVAAATLRASCPAAIAVTWRRCSIS